MRLVGADEGRPLVAEEYVGIDLHRKRMLIVRKNPVGELVGSPVRIDNDPVLLAAEIAKAGPDPEVVIEATYGWYWVVDFLQNECGAKVHLAHPLGLNWGHRRRKDDVTDAVDLVDMLRLGRLPEAWIAPPQLRQTRELVRYRAKLVALRSGLKAQVHSVLAKEGVSVPMTDLFGAAGNRLLNEVPLGRAYEIRVRSLRGLIEVYHQQIRILEKQLAPIFGDDPGYQAIQQIPGIGPILGQVFVAEIGDIGRFPTARHLASWTGLTPRHHESDDKVVRGRITKQGSRLVRWAAVEAAQKLRSGSWLKRHYQHLADRRGKSIAKVAIARRIVTLVFYGLRDGHIRCLDTEAAA
jgi:transposase